MRAEGPSVLERLVPFRVRIYHFIVLPAIAMAMFLWIARWADYLAIPWFIHHSNPDIYLAIRSAVIGLLMASLIAVLAIRYKSEYETKLRQRNVELEETRDFLSRIIEGSAEAIIARDAEGRVTSWNRAAEKIYGWTAEEMIGKSADPLLPEDESRERFEERRRQLARGLTIRDFEAERLRKDGKRIKVRITSAPLLGPDGKFAGTIGIVRDVTQLKEMEALLLERERLAAVGELAAIVAHEVRNPLAGIRGGCEILLEGYPPGEPRHEIGQEILRQVDRLNGTVHELLLFARPNVMEAVPTDLHALLRRVAANVRDDPQNREVEILVGNDGEAPIAEADPRQIEQVFLNLLLNACQAIGHRGTIRVRTARDGDAATVRVEDEGPGIPRERLATIFKPFYTTKTQGTGLGLAVVKKIVDAHAGTVTVESVEGKGTTFTVRIPLRQERA